MRQLTTAERLLLDEARTAVLATIDPTGSPRLVPICYATLRATAGAGLAIYSPLDAKPKRVADPHLLARARDIAARSAVSLLVDHWDEDWKRLGWLRIRGRADLLEADDPAGGAERARAIAALRSKYPQYADHDLEARPIVRIQPTDVSSWGALRG